MQTEAPVGDHVPTGQSLHTIDDVDPPVGDHVPALHVLHVLTEVALKIDE